MESIYQCMYLITRHAMKKKNRKRHTRQAGGGSKNGRARGSSSNSDSIIALLDIFGFESFQTNSFEQLCINYCNEKLNNHFNEHVFKGEIAAYAAEGVVVPNLVFKDNKPILDFIEGKGDGLYSILDEQVKQMRSTQNTCKV